VVLKWIVLKCILERIEFLGAFEELQEATISWVISVSVCLSVCLSVRSHEATHLPLDGFSWKVRLFQNFVDKKQVILNQTRINGTLCENICTFLIIFFLWRCSPTWAKASSFLVRFLDHTQRRTTVGRTPLDEWSARRRDLYLTTRNPHNRQTSMTPVGFEPKISAVEQTYA